MMKLFSFLRRSGSYAATVEPTSTPTFTPAKDQFHDVLPDIADSPALPPKTSPPVKRRSKFALPEEPQSIRDFLSLDHRAEGHHDATHFPQSKRRELRSNALRNAFRVELEGYSRTLESHVRMIEVYISNLNQERDGQSISFLQRIIADAKAQLASNADEIVQLEIDQGRGAIAVRAYELGFHEGLSDLFTDDQEGSDLEFTPESL